MTVHADRMRANLDATHGALFSQRALLALVESGRSRDEAYRIVQENAQRAWDERTPFRELLAEAAPELDLDAVFDPAASCVRARDRRAARRSVLAHAADDDSPGPGPRRSRGRGSAWRWATPSSRSSRTAAVCSSLALT